MDRRHCGICGERFKTGDHMAEVLPTEATAGATDLERRILIINSVLVHQQCYLDRQGQYELA